jgi:secreted trypsin-like serine protease
MELVKYSSCVNIQKLFKKFYKILGCARMQVPGVYCRVQNFSDWIKNTVEST